MSEVEGTSPAPEEMNKSEEDPELDMEVEENFELCGKYGGARVRLLSQKSVKEELLDGDCSEYEEITVEVDGDFFLKEENVKEEESFETEEITYQLKINSDNELDSGSEDEDERLLIAGRQQSDEVQEILADDGEQQSDEVVHRDLVAAGEGVAESLVESTFGESGEEGLIGQVSVGDCDEGEATPMQTTPFIVSEIKEEFQPYRLFLPEEQLVATEEQMETGQGTENYSITLTPEHFLNQLLGGNHTKSSQRKKGILEDNIEDEVGLKENLETAGATNHALLDASAQSIETEVSEKEQELEEEPGRRDTCPLCAESGQVFSAGQNEMATHFVQVHNIMDQGYECTECGYKSRHRSHLKDHINAMHLEAKFKCDLCDYETKYKNRIKSHRVAVHKIGGLPCPSCDYVASEPWVLSQHVKFMHKMKDLNGTEGDMRFKCKFCDYKATQKSHLLCHERAIHKQVQLTCQLCGFQSRWKSRLNRHIKAQHMSFFIHCDHCEFKATEKFALKVHIKKQHGDITFACFKCSEDFITRLDLKKHLSDVHFMEIM